MPATILSDNGVSSGSAGIKTTGANDGILALQTTTAGGTATTAVTIGTDQSVTFAQSANLPNTFGFKNRIINGGMVIAQANGTNAVSSGSSTVDRFGRDVDTDGASTFQQVSDAPTGFKNSLKFTTTTADSSLTGVQRVRLYQRIEGYNVADLMLGTASAGSFTLSFWVKSSLTGTFGGSFSNSAFDRSYPFSYAISAANTWEYKTVVVSGDTSGTWLSDNGIGLAVNFSLGVASGYQGTAGVWASAGLLAPTGTVSVIGTLNATWQVTGVQLERGSTATSFDFRDYGRELILCQRYYQLSGGVGRAVAPSTMEAYCVFGVQMRATPTVTIQNGTSNCAQLGRAQVNINSISTTFIQNNCGVGIVFVSADTGLTSNLVAVAGGNAFGFSAEL
jgi:hypothetical protein